MKYMEIAAVKRHTLFSPNNIGNDALIFEAVCAALKVAGLKVNQYTEQEFLSKDINEDVVVTMLRNEEAVHKLQQFEKRGGLAVNSGFGIENCTREKMTRLLLENNIPHPQSTIVDVKELVTAFPANEEVSPCWVKRGDFHAIHQEDVTYVRNAQNLREIMSEYALRGIKKVVINEHLEGDLLKFYGVAGTPFFYHFYPFEKNHSKFGHETINGKPEGIPFSTEQLKQICDAAARVLNVDVYGGDCIISQDGSIRIIDFNDWPSFAPCREQAGEMIATAILQKIKNYHG
ncbi:hypothetical protein D0T50_05935 [Bacteroides sp. 214]|uniref:hypothetical protein n=1 Tax=Bacteroides sp. 214 TaxID=2302935 RepID=UPI0013D7FEBC|nr:hypothetical protein [Bacteroides sp. 214]NDW12430.1 hypothetical protein [Bacteroides sp. 214]